LRDDTLVDSFTEWAQQVEPRLRHALTASFGPQVGKEAAADALSQAWEKWDLIRVKDNPLGYVYGIGRNKARRMKSRRRPVFFDVPPQRLPEVEPGLPAAIARLSDKQRIVVTLLYGYEWTMSEVAELMGVAKPTVQKHAERGLARLRKTLGVDL
jgi:DNA-directed RNA polymerase specialized sigma24 family protein